MCECLSFSVCGPRAVCVCLLSVSVYVYVSVLCVGGPLDLLARQVLCVYVCVGVCLSVYVSVCVGGPLDLLARQVLCSATEVLARQVAENIERIDMGRD